MPIQTAVINPRISTESAAPLGLTILRRPYGPRPLAWADRAPPRCGCGAQSRYRLRYRGAAHSPDTVDFSTSLTTCGDATCGQRSRLASFAPLREAIPGSTAHLLDLRKSAEQKQPPSSENNSPAPSGQGVRRVHHPRPSETDAINRQPAEAESTRRRITACPRYLSRNVAHRVFVIS
jgi:hypothetical protein